MPEVARRTNAKSNDRRATRIDRGCMTPHPQTKRE
jgi:hypothetical protein